jgi:hypothetical protein
MLAIPNPFFVEPVVGEKEAAVSNRNNKVIDEGQSNTPTSDGNKDKVKSGKAN